MEKLKIFKGAGWLLGLAAAISGAIIVFTLSSNFAAAISAALPIGVAMGISLEQKFQGKDEYINPKRIKIMLTFLTLGFIALITLFFVEKLI